MSERTLSSAEGWLACGAWEKDSRPPGPAAELGSQVHRVVAAGITGTTVATSYEAGRIADKALSWLANEGGFKFDLLTCEDAYAVATGGRVRLLGRDIGREYTKHGATPEDICGSADVVGPATVIDLKTGRAASWEKHEAQMRTLGYCVAKVQGLDRVRCIVLHATKDGATPYERELDALDLAAVGHELAVARTLPRDQPRPGKHCDASWCGARAGCRAYIDWRVSAA